MTLGIRASVRAARLQVLVNAIDAAATPGRLRLYPAPQPATGAATSLALQAEITLAQPCATVAGAQASFAAGPEGLRVDDEPIAWGRFVDGDGQFVMDADVSATGNGGLIQIDNVAGAIGSFVRIEAGSIAE